MYDTKYKCRYYEDNIFLENNDITDDEKDLIRNLLYKEDLINIFCMSENDDFCIFDNILCNLYQKIKNYKPLEECMIKASSYLLSENSELGLCILYSYDFMHITHLCVSEYLETGSILQENIEILKKYVNNS